MSYRIKKILNNNVVQATHNFQEYIIVGLGVGFNSKLLQIIPEEKIEKVFELKQEDYYKTSALIKELPEDVFFRLYRVIDQSSKASKIPLSTHAYVTLIDHLHFAFDRLKSGQDIKNLLIYDLRILYPDEFSLGEKILDAANKEFDLKLPFDEVGFLTMHIINGAHLDIDNKSSLLVDSVLDMLNIIRDYYLISLKPEEANTQRIMTHLKMLAQRVISKVQLDFDEVILYNVIEEFQSAYICALEIQKYIEHRFGATINSQELVYLTIHLNRLEMVEKHK